MAKVWFIIFNYTMQLDTPQHPCTKFGQTTPYPDPSKIVIGLIGFIPLWADVWEAATVFFCQLSSPLLSLLPMMKLSNSRKYLEYELTIMNLWGTWHHYQPPLLSFSICSLFLYMLTVFMLPLCSKFMIKWWLTCLWGIHCCYYSFFYLLLFFIFSHI